MFERRLKIFFFAIVLTCALLLLRAVHLQVVGASYWKDKAKDSTKRVTFLETSRGRILDYKGRELAKDEPCIDAAVDFRAITRDPKWMQQQALARAVQRPDREYRRADKDLRRAIVEQELKTLGDDLDDMWRTLCDLGHRTGDEMEELKTSIRQRVDARRRYIWYQRYAEALAKTGTSDGNSWLERFVASGGADEEIDKFSPEVSEQVEAHTILPAIDNDTHNRLKKQIERFPGLVLRASKHRVYPYGEAACHVLGHLSTADADDLKRSANDDELARYWPNDAVGRAGLESICEAALRGLRGREVRLLGDDDVVDSTPAVPGRDVRATIDVELQRDVENVFRRVEWHKDGALVEAHEMHGAAIVIDVPTGEVRALVSYPTFDVNRLDDDYYRLASDYLNQPLLNRATQAAHEPGSTVKPIVGLGAITQGALGVEEGIRCTGFLIVRPDGRPERMGRCWTASRFYALLGDSIRDHAFGADGHPAGQPLTVTDAIQRSCNVFFETVGDRLGIDGLSYWYDQFGLGRKTGIGLPERSGLLPNGIAPSAGSRRAVSWFSAIGQTQILTTPIQMANVAATIARDGVWVRPHLTVDAQDAPTTQPDRVDLKLSREGVAAIKLGMFRVVNRISGTGHFMARPDVYICGKSGTAQAAPLKLYVRDERGLPVKGPDGRNLLEAPALSTLANPNPKLPWYRGSGQTGTDVAHAWFIGFAPADHPTVAFAVMLEYGGSGGTDGGLVARPLLDAIIRHGYLPTHK